MTETEILEGNKLIASFVGDCFGLKWSEINGFYLDENGSMAMPTNRCGFFHKSWDWLMPVVEKIGNLKSLETDGEWYDFAIQNGKVPKNSYYTYIGHVGEYSRNLGKLVSVKSESLIESVWLAVIEFIKWYNENVKK